MEKLRSPFVYFGGKRMVADKIWKRFGDDIKTYIEPFCGSAAVLLARPDPHGREIINDIDGYVVNFWRALKADPRRLEYLMYYPSTEIDLHARFNTLRRERDGLRDRLRDDDSYFDEVLASAWASNANTSIGISGLDFKRDTYGSINHLTRPSRNNDPDYDLASAWVYNRNNAIGSEGTDFQRGQINSLPNIINPKRTNFNLNALAQRLIKVYVTCGDWKRVVKSSIITEKEKIAVFLDPPYKLDASDYDKRVYNDNDQGIHEQVIEFCQKHHDSKNVRIALCGYKDSYDVLGWEKYQWIANGGFANMSKKKENMNRKLETVWFSPSCLHDMPTLTD